MRQYRLRTIMALIVVIAVSLWCGMLIERARRPTPTNSAGISFDAFDAPEEMVGPTTPANVYPEPAPSRAPGI